MTNTSTVARAVRAAGTTHPGRKHLVIPARLIVLGCAVAFTLGACATIPTQEVTAAGTPSSTTAAAKPDGNHVSTEGTLSVGTDIKAGTYKTTVPADSLNCYWARLKGTSGQLEDIIANGNGKPDALVTVTIKPTDKAFETNGCGTWVKSR
jgi:hypothetical protein